MTPELVAEHEAAHAVVAEALGLTWDALQVVGGQGRCWGLRPTTTEETVLVALAGPVTEWWDREVSGEELLTGPGASDMRKAMEATGLDVDEVWDLYRDRVEAILIDREDRWDDLTRLLSQKSEITWAEWRSA